MHGALQPGGQRSPFFPPDEGGSPKQDPVEFDLRSFLGFLSRRRWAILGTFLFVGCLAALVTSQIKPRYTATALVAVESRDSQLLGFDQGAADGGIGTQVDTEVEIANSSAVFSRAADQLNLAGWPEFAPRRPLLDRVKVILGIAKPPPGEPAPAAFAQLSADQQARLLRDLADVSSISRRELTSVIAFSATSQSAKGAAEIANALADAYLQEQIEARLTSADRAANFLRGRVEGLATDIARLEAEIQTFLSSKLAEVSSPEAAAIIAKLAESTRIRDTGTANLAALRSAIATSDYDHISALLGSSSADLARQRQQLTAALASSDEAQLAQVREQLAAINQQLKTAAEQQESIFQTTAAAADTRMDDLRKQLDAALSAQQLPKDFSVQLFRLQRDLETRRALYDSFLTKLGQIEQQGDFKLPDSRIVAAALPPDRASFPPVLLIGVGTIILGLFAGIGLAFLRENYIGGVNSIEQLERLTGITIAASVPRETRSGERPDAVVVSQPLSAFSESIRRARLGIATIAGSNKICALVTSSVPGEGKTTIALSLARQIAMSGTRTLLIDADLRHPSLRAAVGANPERGLLDYLSEETPGTDGLTIVKEPQSKLEMVLGAHAAMVATDVLLLSDRFAQLMAYARANYDAVIIDTPPIGLVVDSRILAKYCNVGVFVVRSGATSQHVVRTSLRELTAGSDLPISGILNEMRSSGHYSYGYAGRLAAYYR